MTTHTPGPWEVYQSLKGLHVGDSPMLTNTHTPGPWTHSEEQGGYMIQVERDAQPIARVAWFDQEANARLIAAAPELLEALGEAISTLETCDVPEMANEGDTVFWLERQSAAIYKARTAIAKARGEK